MKTILILIIFVHLNYVSFGEQLPPCKVVKLQMSSEEVLKLAGEPTEIDSLGYDSEKDGKRDFVIIWHYGTPDKPGNQRVQFVNNKVTEVVPDGIKYDELLELIAKGEIPKDKIEERLAKVYSEGCK